MVRRWFALLAIGGALASAIAACASDDGDLQPQPLPPDDRSENGGSTNSPTPPFGSDDKNGETPTGAPASDAGADGSDGGSDQ